MDPLSQWAAHVRLGLLQKNMNIYTKIYHKIHFGPNGPLILRIFISYLVQLTGVNWTKFTTVHYSGEPAVYQKVQKMYAKHQKTCEALTISVSFRDKKKADLALRCDFDQLEAIEVF